MEKEIINLTENEIEILSYTWALEMNRPTTYYRSILKDVISGKRSIDSLPYIVVKGLAYLGYKVGSLTEMLSILQKIVKSKGVDEFINNYPELAEEISAVIKSVGEKYFEIRT